jgi:hypothetical protein
VRGKVRWQSPSHSPEVSPVRGIVGARGSVPHRGQSLSHSPEGTSLRGIVGARGSVPHTDFLGKGIIASS